MYLGDEWSHMKPPMQSLHRTSQKPTSSMWEGLYISMSHEKAKGFLWSVGAGYKPVGKGTVALRSAQVVLANCYFLDSLLFRGQGK